MEKSVIYIIVECVRGVVQIVGNKGYDSIYLATNDLCIRMTHHEKEGIVWEEAEEDNAYVSDNNDTIQIDYIVVNK